MVRAVRSVTLRTSTERVLGRCYLQGRIVMYCSTQNFSQIPTVFGGEFVQEQHRDAIQSYLAATEKHNFREDFDAVLQALRSALSLR